MDKPLEQICQLWKYQNSECRFTQLLKSKIQGYDNNNPYNIVRAKRQRQAWLHEQKIQKVQPNALTETKDQLLYDLLHPDQIYIKEKKQYYQIKKEPYGKNHPTLKLYQDAAKYNFEPNIVNFQMYSEEKNQKQKQAKKHIDYVKTFYEKFGEILQEQSPEHWKLLLFDVLNRVLEFKEKDEEDLSNALNILLPNQDKAIRYLVNFRTELVSFLQQSKFLAGETKINFDEGQKKRKVDQKEKRLNWFKTGSVGGEQLVQALDFLEMKENQLIQKVPTLKRFDHPEYIHFRMEPLPKIDKPDVERVRVSDFVVGKYSKCFESEFLNPVQSIVFDHAFNSSGNMLVCAPTGAGKTNIATLTILQAIKSVPTAEDVRVVYISPMKALANQLVDKFSKKLAHLKTRESTGDIQLSQRQLATTNILVTTPEKWDVTTRKSTTILDTVNLVILDEVHLLNDERGWVIESIVARMFRTTERTQRQIRLVALSATLPNYYDVADFLKVDRQKGLFYFDNNYRPVPLTINFIGIKNPKDLTNNMSRKRRPLDIYNEKCYQIALKYLRSDKQVLIFVHSRKQTVKYCEYILERAKQLGDEHLLKPISNVLKNYPNIRDRNLKKFCTGCVGFHHAGMVRNDRNIAERMFQKGDIKILLATATLAWGVNMPAYAVIIKGTDIYDPSQSQSRNLSILDVQQMFGRAGRPQYDTVGEATLMSDHSKVNHYMGALTNSSPIDSKFLKCLKQSLNAEITSGTVTNEDEAFDWLKYTFLAVRLKRCPEVYGCQRGANEAQIQYNYDCFIRQRVHEVLNELDKMRLIRLDRKGNTVTSTELGRITSHYYIKCQTMEHFCNSLHIYSADDPSMKRKFEYKTDLQLLNILAECKQFESIKPRPQQFEQLKQLMKYWFLDQDPDFILKRDKSSVNIEEGAYIETPQKVILLLQGYLRDITYENFSLINDTQFVVQNSIRLLRCMLDLCSKKNQAENVKIILQWCKYIENRVYKDDSPLRQFTKFSYSGYNAMRTRKHMEGFLPQNYYEEFAGLKISVGQFIEGDDDVQRMALLHIRKQVKHPKLRMLKMFCQYIPFVDIQYTVKPIAQTILKIDLKIIPEWTFNPKWHNKSEIFWILFDDQQELLHSETITIQEEFVKAKKEVKTSFYIRYKGNSERSYRLTITSDRWMTDDNQEIDINLQTLGIDMDTTPFTELLNLDPLPVLALKNPLFESLYKFKFFNPLQTQMFFSLYQEKSNILIGAPTGSGKTIMSELAILNLIKSEPGKKCVYVAPLKSLVKERLKDWVPRFKKIKKSVVELSGDFTPDLESLKKADIIVTTPEKWDGITRSKQREYTHQVGLIIFDEIHLLGQDRGAVIEVIVSRMNKENKIRMIGLSTAMANGTDVADWFGCDKYNFFNFRPTVRPVPVEIHFEGFSEKHYCPRMATMNKPAYNHIKKFSDGKPVIIFVSSRRQTRLTANDLISYSQMQNRQTAYVKCDMEIIKKAIDRVHDEYLKQTLNFGIVMHHAGLDNSDRQICEELFVNNKIQIMIATSTLAWGVNFPARLVIIKGTEYFDPKSHKYVDFQATDLLQMIGRAGRPQFDDKGVAMVYVESSKKNFYRKFLNDPFPIESSLLEQLQDHVNAQITRGQINNEDECIDWITWSFLFRRILKNPNYYGLQGNNVEKIKQFLHNLATRIFTNLKNSQCIEILENEDEEPTVIPTEMGFIASTYYLKHQTIYMFKKQIQPGLTFKSMLKILSQAQQFKQTPLRHNEDIHNKELSDIAPFKAKVFSSPQDKTFLLLQMHMYHLPFPIRDYVNDCTLILDSSSRVVMGLIEMAKEKKLFDATRLGILIQQAVYQGLGCNIPFIEIGVWKKMSKKFLGLAGIVEAFGKGPDGQDYKKMVDFLKKQVVEYDDYKQKMILDAIKSFPRMKLHAKAKNFDSEKNAQNQKAIEAGGEAIVYIDIFKENHEIPNRLVVQKHKKIKDCTWWVLVTDRDNNLLETKKVVVKRSVKLKLQIDVPEDGKVDIYLMADSYVGLDQVYELKLC